MDRSDVPELHFITDYANLSSIAERGILAHSLAANISHESIASAPVQDLRAGKTVPGGLKLHDYANLYFDARNPMMYVVRQHPRTVVVRVSSDVLDLPNVVITDGNAASATTQFYAAENELHMLDKGPIFAPSWNSSNPFEKVERKRQRCSEVLVPWRVPPSMLCGVLVGSSQLVATCTPIAPDLTVEVRPNVFFG